MNAYQRFQKLLKRDFAPLLRGGGFKGSGSTFRRMKGDRFDIVNVQGSSYGGKCSVNLAAHFNFLPSIGGGGVTEPKKFQEYHCVFSDRLHESTEADHWWSYGESDADAETSVANLVDMYQRRGCLFFAKFEPFPEVFDRITPAELDAGDFSKFSAAMSETYAALTMARIMNHLGRREKCREFVEFGLRHVGSAEGLRFDLEQLRDLS